MNTKKGRKMRLDELSEEQKLELKQRILEDRNEHLGEGTSYGELANADELVDDEVLETEYGGTEFSPDDFACTASKPDAFVKSVPQWAVPYLVNSDDSGLTSEDKSLVDQWVAKLLANDGLELLAPIYGSENEFCFAPAFGLACGTVDFAARRTDGKD